jgi:alkylation response protein AidB-like acyl-CoA dehydrogenase
MTIPYTAPLKDLVFTLKVLNLEKILDLPKFEDFSQDLVDSILDEAGKFARDILSPLNLPGHLKGAQWKDGNVTLPDGFKEAYAQFVQNGWNPLPFSPDIGGMGLPWSVTFAIQEIWQAANLSFGLCPVLTQGTIELLAQHGSEKLKALYLPKLVSGAWTGTMNLTEPQAGTDVGAIKTQAVKKGDYYRIKGQKIYISYGDHDLADNIVHMVLARVPGSPEGTKGLSLFLVPKMQVDDQGNITGSNDVHCVSIEHKMGLHCSPTAMLSFGDDEGSKGYLIGEEGQGIQLMFVMMNNARLSVGIQGIGIAERAYQQAYIYANERIQSKALSDPKGPSVPIIAHADVKRMLAEMKSLKEAARGIALMAGSYLDLSTQENEIELVTKYKAYVDFLTPIVKSFGTEVGARVADLGIQIHGGMGFIEETGAAQHFEDVRVTMIYEGTNGVQASDLLFRKTLKDDGKIAHMLLKEIEALAKSVDANAPLAKMAGQLTVSADTVRKAITHIQEASQKDVDLAAAMATPYLNLWAITLGGFVHLKLGLAALQAEDTVYKEKVNLASYYGDRFLVESQSLAGQIFNAAHSLMTL